MKRYLSSFSVVLILAAISGVLVSALDAQVPRKGTETARRAPAAEKAGPPASRSAAIQQFIRNRKSQNVVAGDPCENSVPITVGTPITAGLQAGDCQSPDGTYVDFYDFQGTAGQAISISLNSSAFDTYLYLFNDLGDLVDENDDGGGGTNSMLPNQGGVMTLEYTGHYFIGANSFDPSVGSYTISVNTPVECAPVSIGLNQTVNGALTNFDCAVNIFDEPYYTDYFMFSGTAGQQVKVSMSSMAVDSYIVLHSPTGDGTVSDDDSGGGLNSLIPATGTFTLPETGTYTIEASTAISFQTGNYTLVLTNADKRIADFDGDGKSDISVWRPSDGNWYWLSSGNNTFSTFHFGTLGDQIVPGNYDGDGRTDFAVFRAGTWYIWGSTAGFSATQFGLASDLPTQGDLDGDGKTDIAVFRPLTGTWYIFGSTAGFSGRQFGALGDKPVVGDYDGDGKADIAVYRPSDGVWYQLRSTSGFTSAQFGIASDLVVPGDYDGDNKTDLAVYRPGDNTWYIAKPTGPPAQNFNAFTFGAAGDIAAPGDFDGDGRADFGIFRPSNGTWFLRRSASGFNAQPFGLNGDKPVEAGYVPTQ